MASKIGEINGKWALVFKMLLVGNSIMLPAVLAWGTWVTTMLFTSQAALQIVTIDRFTASMFIEVQDTLAEKNPQLKWLSAGEVRRIQQQNPPYRLPIPHK